MGEWASPILVVPKKEPFGIKIGPSAFSYVQGKVLAQSTVFTLNFLDDIMNFSKMRQGASETP